MRSSVTGYRTAVRLERGSARMLTRNALDRTARLGPIAAATAKLKARTAYIDGEIVVLDDAGISDFGALQQALSQGRTERMVYFAFDLPHLDGRELTLSQPRGLAAMCGVQNTHIGTISSHWAEPDQKPRIVASKSIRAPELKKSSADFAIHDPRYCCHHPGPMRAGALTAAWNVARSGTRIFAAVGEMQRGRQAGRSLS
jgi:hypothetical protein